ncbi:MAG: pilus (MSHA type) biogenesis protein MshL [Rhodocyclaceae bacterium]|nr:pilus (MSHA type) biogenesis protein MshL [Rhodocyclaceae bacterium]
MKRSIKTCVTLSSLVALSGCSILDPRPDATLGRIQDELKAAALPAKPAPVAPAAVPAGPPPTVTEAAERRFDLAVNNAPAAQVFTAIASGTSYSMLISPDLSGTVTVNLKNVTLREALDTLREMFGYEYKVMGSRILVQSNTLQTRIFKVNYLAEKRQGQTDVQVTSGSISSSSSGAGGSGGSPSPVGGASGGGQTRFSSQVSTRSDSDFWGELGQSLGVIVGKEGGRSVVLNPLSGVVVIKAFPAEMRQVEHFLHATRIAVEREVMLEAKIIDVQLKDEFKTGINWAYFHQGGNRRFAVGVAQPGATVQTNGILANGDAVVTPGMAGSLLPTATGTGFAGLAFQAANFASLLNFLETQGNVQVLSSPRIATLNNQKAVLKVGTDNFFVTNVSTTTNSSGGSTVTTPSITVQPFFSGIALDVTPQIDDNGEIILHVHPSVSTVTDQSKVINLGQMGTYTLPLASSSINETDSIVRVKDGAIVAIGGLMKQEQTGDRSQVPGLGSLPVVGTLFGQSDRTFSKEEIVILIKPTVIDSERAWQQGLEEVQSRMPGYVPPRAKP